MTTTRRPIRGVAAAVVTALAVVAAGVAVTADEPDAALSEPLSPTLPQAEGPYYPVEIPEDHDSDLTVVAGGTGPASGEPLEIEGLLLTTDGTPVAGAIVEIWQTDHQGIYLHPADPDVADRDAAFQGFGRTTTEEDGRWSFTTILPEVYGSRPRHVHAKVLVEGETVLTTQIYFSGGDIPAEGIVAPSGEATDALITEAMLVAGEDGNERLVAEHLFVIP